MYEVPKPPPWLSEPSPVERLRHCWVTADEQGQVPALLLEWRQTPDGWEARVVRPVLDAEDGKWRARGGVAASPEPVRRVTANVPEHRRVLFAEA